MLQYGVQETESQQDMRDYRAQFTDGKHDSTSLCSLDKAKYIMQMINKMYIHKMIQHTFKYCC